MATRMAIAVAYYTDQNGNRRFNFLTKDESWFWKNMRIRVKQGLMPNLDECAVVYLKEPTSVKDLNWPGKLYDLAPDPITGKRVSQVLAPRPTSMDKLLADIAERKLISELANLARPDGVDA